MLSKIAFALGLVKLMQPTHEDRRRLHEEAEADRQLIANYEENLRHENRRFLPDSAMATRMPPPGMYRC